MTLYLSLEVRAIELERGRGVDYHVTTLRSVMRRNARGTKPYLCVCRIDRLMVSSSNVSFVNLGHLAGEGVCSWATN